MPVFGLRQQRRRQQQHSETSWSFSPSPISTSATRKRAEDSPSAIYASPVDCCKANEPVYHVVVAAAGRKPLSERSNLQQLPTERKKQQSLLGGTNVAVTVGVKARKSRRDAFDLLRQPEGSQKSLLDELCPSCNEPFDSNKKRKLIDSCGHAKCFSCTFAKDACSLCLQSQQESVIKARSLADARMNRRAAVVDSPFKRDFFVHASSESGDGNRPLRSPPVRSAHSRSESPSLLLQPDKESCFIPRRRFLQSPKPNRLSWMQRHCNSNSSRRPNTVNVDDSTLSALLKAAEMRQMPTEVQEKFKSMWGIDDHSIMSSSSTASSLVNSSAISRIGFLSPSHYARSSSLGCSNRVPPPPPPLSANQNSLGRESGFQSTTSLSSHAAQQHNFKFPTAVTSRLTAERLSGRNSLTSLVSSGCNNQAQGSPSFRSRSSCARSSLGHQVHKDVRDEFAKFCHTRWPLQPLFFEVPQRNRRESLFVGRKWLFSEIQEHTCSNLPTNRGVIIAGAAGTGKTAIVLKLVENSCFGRGEPIYQATTKPDDDIVRKVGSQVVAYHFCQAENISTCAVPGFVHSLAAQLSQAPSLRPYNDLLTKNYQVRTKLTLNACLANPDAALEEGILEPLRTVQGTEGVGSFPCLIVLDALCDGGAIGDFISKHLCAFPPWIKFICTLRPEVATKTTVLGLPFHRLSLDKSSVDERIRKDVSDFISARMQRSRKLIENTTPISNGRSEGNPLTKFVLHLTDLASGNFLFCHLTLDLIEKGHLVIKSSSFKVLPVSLDEIFRLEFNLRFPTLTAFQKVSDLLSVCLASPEAMSAAEIFQSVLALSVTSEQMTWPEFVSRLNSLTDFLVRRADDSVMFHHSAFREWLLNRQDTKFYCDPHVGHLGIALRMCRSLQQEDGSPKAPEQILDLAHHILRARIFDEDDDDTLKAVWLAQASGDLSAALGCPRNVFSPDVALSRLLLQSGASPNHYSGHLSNAPLVSVFVERGDEEMVSLLLEFGADGNGQNTEGVTPLMFASIRGHVDVASSLIEAGAAVNMVDRSDHCALVHAARNGHLGVVEHLVSCDWPCRSEKDLGLGEATQQALIAAASSGRFQVMEYLLDLAEVKVDMVDTLCGETALCAAAAAGQMRCCEILLHRGATVHMSNLKGTPPIHLATKHGHWSVADLLLTDGGASPTAIDGAGKTPLMVAAAEGHVGLLELLMSRELDLELDRTDREGFTVLSWACLKGQFLAAEILIKRGADPNTADTKGRSPLDLAAYQGSPQVVQLLLENGAVVEHVDVNGMRPLDRAIGCGKALAVQCFLRKGAKLGPATWAMASGKPDILLLLLNKLLDDGNTLFKKKHVNEAAHRYRYALRRLPSSFAGQHRPIFERLQCHLLLNLSRCERKLGHVDEAINLADQVLKINPACFEAFYAKAKANREDGRLHSALNDLMGAARVAPQNRDIHKVILRVKDEINSTEAKRKLISKMDTDSTSGVDSTGSSCTKDFEPELSSTVVI